MAQCFVACGCDDGERITKADLDRFTDIIDNVLNDEKGRKHFRNFMFTCKMKDGRRKLDFWERVEKLNNYNENTASSSSATYLKEIDKILDEAERIDELDFAILERLTIARESDNVQGIQELMIRLKADATKSLHREYNRFRHHFIPSK